MKHKILLFTMLMWTFPAAAYPTINPQKSADEQIAFWDKNGNGTVEFNEFSGPAVVRFRRIDVNHDGIISLQEMIAYRNRKKPIVERMMKRWDKNGDGQISREEYLLPVVADFNRLDANHDRHISRQELVSDWQRRKEELQAYMREKERGD